MSLSLNIIIIIAILLGFSLKYLIFHKEKKCNDSKYFITSKMMLEFLVEIIVIFLGLFISMSLTQWENDKKEKELAVTTLEQACEFAQEQYDDIHEYLLNYDPKTHSNSSMLELNTVLDMEYYRNIVSDEIIIKHLNTHTYGVFNKYVKYIEVLDSQIEDIDFAADEMKHLMLVVRERYFARLITIIDVCALEASGELTEQEYNKIIEKLDFLVEEYDERFSEFEKGSDCLVENFLLKDNEQQNK